MRRAALMSLWCFALCACDDYGVLSRNRNVDGGGDSAITLDAAMNSDGGGGVGEVACTMTDCALALYVHMLPGVPLSGRVPASGGPALAGSVQLRLGITPSTQSGGITGNQQVALTAALSGQSPVVVGTQPIGDTSGNPVELDLIYSIDTTTLANGSYCMSARVGLSNYVQVGDFCDVQVAN